MFDRFKARMTGPGVGDSAPPTSRKGRLSLLTAIAVLLCVGLSASSVLAAPLSISIRMTDLTNGGVYNLPGQPVLTASGALTSTGQQAVGVFTASADSRPTESALLSDLNTTTIDVYDRGPGITPATLEILVTVQGYTLPAGTSLKLTSAAQGVSSQGLAGQPAVLQSWADANNGQFTTVSGGGVVSPGAQNGALITPTPPSGTYDFGSQANLGTTFPRNATPYSVTQRFRVTLEAGNRANLTLATSLVAVPLPSTAGLGSVLLGGLGVGAIRRRSSRRVLA